MMIARIDNYSATVAVPSPGRHEESASYSPLIERICFNETDVKAVTMQLRLILKSGLKPLVVVFEPTKNELIRHDAVILST